MQVVDAVQIHVLCMPRKQSLPHSKVQVRRIDAFNPNTELFVDGIQYSAESVRIPYILVLVVDGARDIGTVDRTVEGNILPEFPLEVNVVRVCWSFITALNRIKCIVIKKTIHSDTVTNIRSVKNALCVNLSINLIG